MDEKKHRQEIVQMGMKLANFRRKLAVAIGQKKINQDEFGEMYGGYSGRQINSYETGSSPVASDGWRGFQNSRQPHWPGSLSSVIGSPPQATGGESHHREDQE